MPLIDMPDRPGNDKAVLTKLTAKRRKSSSTVRTGSGIYGRISEIAMLVEREMGEYKDKFEVIKEESRLKEYVNKIIENKHVAIDTETSGLDPLLDTLAGICIYTPRERGAYIPVNHISYITRQKVEGQLSGSIIIQEFSRFIDEHVNIDMFNGKFDIRFLRSFGLKNIYCTWDGFLAAKLLNENEEQGSLKPLHNKYCLDGKGNAFKYDDLFKGIPFTEIPVSVGYMYAANDPVITYELCEYQRQYLRADSEREDLRELYHVMTDIEMPCMPVIADMEDNGILFDNDYQKELSEKYHKLLNDKLKNFYSECETYSEDIERYRLTHSGCKLDDPINIASASQLAVLLYDIIGVPAVDQRSPRGTGEDILLKIDLPITRAILDYRGIYKLINTYIDKLPNCTNITDNRIHCSFNQYGAKTGRMSSNNPNLQNIPSHNKDIRQLFRAPDGYVLMSADFSQQEPKMMAQLCGDPQMLEAYRQNKDLYAQIASLSFNKPYEECLEFNPDGTTNPEGKERRNSAKKILLGTLYGRGVNSIAEQLGTTPEQAQRIKDAVFKGFPSIPKFEKESLEMARDYGYVTTYWGRKRRLPELQLDEYEITYIDGIKPDYDLLDFESGTEYAEVPKSIKNKYISRLRKAKAYNKAQIIQEAKDNGILIKDNSMKIADAKRQCVNARIQGSAGDMTKLALIKVGTNQRLRELGFRLLVPIHDELLAECPEEHVRECRELMVKLMTEAAGEKLTIPISCDVAISRCWYGEELSYD